MDRDALRRLSNRQLFERGSDAAKVGDRALFDLCVHVFEDRDSAQAAELLDVLHECWLDEARPRGRKEWPGHAELLGDVAVAGLEVITDGKIVRARRAVIERANRSIWLSTYQYDDRDDSLTQLLCRLARGGKEVRVFASTGRVSRSARAEQQLEQIHHAGGHVWHEGSTHSKCLIVDDELVMVGSGNLDKSYRDLVLQFRSKRVAEQLQSYLRSLQADRFD